MLGDITLAQFALGSLCVVVAGLTQATLGFGYALISVPALALINPAFVPVPVIWLSILLTAFTAARERGEVVWPSVGWILSGRALGTGIGLGILSLVDANALQGVIGIVILCAVGLLSVPWSHRERTRFWEFVGGTVSGVMHMTAAISGPPLALLFHRDRGPTVRASLGVIFFVGGWITLLGHLLGARLVIGQFLLALALAPSLLLGFWLSRFHLSRVEGRPIRVAIRLFAALGGLALLVRAA